MKSLFVGIATLAAAALAQADCQLATRNFEVSRNNMRPDVNMVQQAYDQMALACGYGPRTFVPAPVPQFQPAPQPMPAGTAATIGRCDERGCWDQHGNRYALQRNGGYRRPDGAFCSARGRTLVCE